MGASEMCQTVYGEGDRIELRNGQTATVAEVLANGKMYVADIDMGDDFETDFVAPEEIKRKLS